MKILGTEVDFSFTNGDDIKKFEDNYEKTVEDLEKASRLEKLSEMYNETCNAIDTFIDNVFGEGTAKNIFKNKDFLDRVQAFKEIAEEKNKKAIELEEKLKSFKKAVEVADNVYSIDRTQR